jgi:hypothetical protein
MRDWMVGSESQFFQCAVASIKSLARNERTTMSLYQIRVPGIFEPGHWHSVIYPFQYHCPCALSHGVFGARALALPIPTLLDQILA